MIISFNLRWCFVNRLLVNELLQRVKQYPCVANFKFSFIEEYRSLQDQEETFALFISSLSNLTKPRTKNHCSDQRRWTKRHAHASGSTSCRRSNLISSARSHESALESSRCSRCSISNPSLSLSLSRRGQRSRETSWTREKESAPRNR